ncbi:hypothetical protein BH18ACI5_BH18ACI5_20820 [soil metagenome]
MGDVAGVHRLRGDNNDAMPASHCESLDEAVALLTDDPLLFEPGTQHRYSIWGWVLVSAVVHRAADEPFARFMVRQVFEPLAMERTVVAETDGLDSAHPLSVPRWVLCPARRQGGATSGLLLPGGRRRVSFHADGPCATRLGDVEPGLVKAETIAAFHTPARLVSGASTTYALGWTVNSVQLAGKSARSSVTAAVPGAAPSRS